MEKKKGIVWFRNDLRVHDNNCLNTALEEMDEVLLVYVYDRKLFEVPYLGLERMGGNKIRFLFQTVEDLRENLENEDLYLHEAYDYPVEYLNELVLEHNIDCIYASEGLGTEEKNDERKVSSFCELKLFNTDRIYEKGNLGFDLKELPLVFTNFRKKVEKQGFIDIPVQFKRSNALSIILPTTRFLHRFAHLMNNSHPNISFHFTGGETMGLIRLSDYIWKNSSITTYKKTRNNLIGSDYSSKFSPWLANGALSIKQVWYEINKFENEVLKNDSTYWLKFELLWREFFKWNLALNQSKLFIKSGFKSPKVIENPQINNNFSDWMEGNTSNEFINANINELVQTGFMSNRGRQITASFLIYELHVDWRLGAAFFEKHLIDFDPASNYGNWTYIAGVGNDPRGGRKFNVEKQIEQYDPDGIYVRFMGKLKT